jgi:hypothetical protein
MLVYAEQAREHIVGYANKKTTAICSLLLVVSVILPRTNPGYTCQCTLVHAFMLSLCFGSSCLP